jgi:hypothetical protein
MGSEQSSTGAAVLQSSQCWALLRSAENGRLAVIVDGEPDIFPVNFLVDHATIVFRTAPGTKLTAALAGPSVAFEADGVDAATATAWSVVVKGRAEEIKHLYDLLDASALPLFPWHAAAKHRFLRIVPGSVSGRSFVIADRTNWQLPLTGGRSVAPE